MLVIVRNTNCIIFTYPNEYGGNPAMFHPSIMYVITPAIADGTVIADKLFKKKWNILILRDLFLGRKYFNEFKQDKPELSNKVLSKTLQNLEENCLIHKETYMDNSTEYRLTTRGKKLGNILYELAKFNLDETDYTENEKEIISNELVKTFKNK